MPEYFQMLTIYVSSVADVFPNTKQKYIRQLDIMDHKFIIHGGRNSEADWIPHENSTNPKLGRGQQFRLAVIYSDSSFGKDRYLIFEIFENFFT